MIEADIINFFHQAKQLESINYQVFKLKALNVNVGLKESFKIKDNQLKDQIQNDLKNINENNYDTEAIEEFNEKYEELGITLDANATKEEKTKTTQNDIGFVERKKNQDYNIVYRNKQTKPMTFSELFGIKDKNSEGNKAKVEAKNNVNEQKNEKVEEKATEKSEETNITATNINKVENEIKTENNIEKDIEKKEKTEQTENKTMEATVKKEFVNNNGYKRNDNYNQNSHNQNGYNENNYNLNRNFKNLFSNLSHIGSHTGSLSFFISEPHFGCMKISLTFFSSI